MNAIVGKVEAHSAANRDEDSDWDVYQVRWCSARMGDMWTAREVVETFKAGISQEALLHQIPTRRLRHCTDYHAASR